MARDRRGIVVGMTANVSARRSLFDRIGLFDEMLGSGAPLESGEDLDLALRTYAAGLVSAADHRPMVVHAGGVRALGHESRRLWKRDGVGLGAALAKSIRTGQWHATWATTSVLVGLWRDAALKIARGRRPFGLALTGVVTAGAADGFLRGLRQPLRRSASTYVFTANRS